MNINRMFRSLFILFIALFFVSVQLQASIVVLNGLSHENTAQPGETYRGTIQIQNTGTIEKSARIYLKDYWFSYTGESKNDDAGTLARSNAAWITYNPELITLEGGEIKTIDYEVKIPANDTLVGTYWSVIMVEGITPPDTIKREMGVTINTAIRYAVQIVTNIGNTGKSDMEFIGLELSKDENENVLLVAVQNVGQRILKPEMNLELFDEEGNSVANINSERRKTFPGTSITTTLVLKGVKPGNYNGVLVANCGEDRMYGTNLTIELK